MWRQIIKRQWIVAILIILGAGLLIGCDNENTVDYSIDGIEKEEQPTGDGKSRLSQFEGEETWHDTWIVTIEENITTNMSVNADVKVSEKAQMSVLEVEEPEFSADYKETIANRIFDEVYYGDFLHLPKKDLAELRDYWYGEYKTYSYSEIPIAFPFESPEFHEALDNIENAGDAYIPVDQYTVNEYIGSCEGRTYTLSFSEIPGDKVFIRRLKWISLLPKDVSEVCPEKFKEKKELAYSPWLFGDWAENHCQISKEEATKEAKLFADKLGLDYPVASTIYPLVWGTPPEIISLAGSEESDDWEVNGYVFTYDLGIDELSFVDFGMEEEYSGFWTLTDREEETQYSLQARLQIYVTDQGVIRAEINNPVEITGILDSVDLLPLDAIKGIMQKEVEEYPEQFHFNAYQLASSFNEMELIYFRVRDKEQPGKFNYIPTWRLATVVRDVNENLLSITNPVLINAIDGSVIDFYDET